MCRGDKLNNKGFTLIETIVAMSILVLVSVPLMDSISRGMRVSRDTSSFQRAVLLGQSVTEGVRSHSVSDLCSTFVKQNTSDGSSTYLFDILDKNVYNYKGYGRLNTDDGVTYAEMPSGNSSFDGNSRKYYYGIYGVESGAKKYDVLIKLDSDKFNDINSKIIPSIVEVGSESTVVIDNTGVLNHIGDKTLKEMARENLGIGSDAKMKCRIDVYVTKHKAGQENTESDTTVARGAYHAYGDITYYVGDDYESAKAAGTFYTFLNIGEDSFDIKNKLKYMYVICNGEGLEGVNDVVCHVDAQGLEAWDSGNVDIPVAIVTSNCVDARWKLMLDNDLPYSKDSARKYLSFLTNNGSNNGVENIYTTDGVTIENFGDSGKKTRRIYELNVQVYDYQENVNQKFKTNVLSNIKSTFIR